MANKNTRLDFILNLVDKVTKPVAKIEKAFTSLGERAKKPLQMIAVGFAGIFASVVGFNQILQPALEMNRALAEVRGFGIAEQALDKLNNKALEFTARYGASAADFVRSSKTINDTISGLSATQLANITKVSNTLGIATKTDAETSTKYLSTLYNAYSQQADAMGRTKWAEQVAAQSALAVKSFRTTTADLLSAFNEADNMASRAGASYAEQLAVYGTLGGSLDAGKVGGVAKGFYENVGNAGAKVGLNFNDANGRLLSTIEIIEKLNGKFGDLSITKNAQAIRDAFGGEASEGVMVLMKNIDKLKGNIDKMGNVHGLEQLSKLADDMVAPWTKFSGAVQSLRTSFGQALIPILAPTMQKLSGIAETLQRWTKLFPNITRLVGHAAVGFLGLSLVVSACSFVFGILKTAVIGFTVVVTGLSKILKALRMVIFAVNLVMYANPVLLVVAGIVALIAIIGLAIYYWDDLSKFLTETFSAAIDWVLEKFNAITEWFNSVGGWSGVLKAAIRGYLTLVFNFVNKLLDYINKIPGVNLGKLEVENIEWLKVDPVPQLEANQAQALQKRQVPKVFAEPYNSNKGGILQQVKNDQLMQNNSKNIHIDKIDIKTERTPNAADLEYNLTMNGA